jgi:hypothetical protein
LKTPVLVPGDDIVEVARAALDAAGLEPQKDDILAVCESPLAITEGRIVNLDDVRPGLTARVLCRFFDQHGSLATAYGMQTAIDLTSLPRILAAFVVGTVGKLVGRRGDFYRIAGRQVAWMDDIPGTMPPYTQDIILGPKDPQAVADRVARSIGCGAAVVDANDLGLVDVMGWSAGIDMDRLVEAMRRNPQGNAAEQTPLVLVRP